MAVNSEHLYIILLVDEGDEFQFEYMILYLTKLWTDTCWLDYELSKDGLGELRVDLYPPSSLPINLSDSHPNLVIY